MPKVGDTISRKLQDGDEVLVNRQPTLSSTSILKHEVKIK